MSWNIKEIIVHMQFTYCNFCFLCLNYFSLVIIGTVLMLTTNSRYVFTFSAFFSGIIVQP